MIVFEVFWVFGGGGLGRWLCSGVDEMRVHVVCRVLSDVGFLDLVIE